MQSPPVLWLFGLPSSGKTTLACVLRDHLNSMGQKAVVLDGDELRGGLCKGLGFNDADRSENIRRAAEVAKILNSQGFLVICAFITPKEHHRSLVRAILHERLLLAYVDCPLDVCMNRDVKGLYLKSRQSHMTSMTGTQDSFVPPKNSIIHLNTDKLSIDVCVSRLVAAIADNQCKSTTQLMREALSRQ